MYEELVYFTQKVQSFCVEINHRHILRHLWEVTAFLFLTMERHNQLRVSLCGIYHGETIIEVVHCVLNVPVFIPTGLQV